MKTINNISFWLLSLLLLTFILSSCDKENTCVKSSGTVVKEARIVDEHFENIELNDKINLIIRQDTVFALNVEAGANLLPLITTEVVNNQLVIKSDNKCSFLRSYDKPINIYLYIKNIKKISIKGQGNITSSNTLLFPEFTIEAFKATGSVQLAIFTDYLKILQHTGPADFTFTGGSKYTYLYTNGNGWFHFENFNSDDAQVNTSGTGDVILKATKTLLVELYAIGNVYYYGNPIVTISQHAGSGEIKKR